MRLIHRLATMCAFAALISLSAQAQELTAQQQRMKSCNAQAKGKDLKGEERQAFMKDCLSGGEELTAQQEKMRTCNRTASERKLKGDERRGFMSDCLRADRGERRSAAGGR